MLRRPSWCTEQCIKMSFGNLSLLLCKTCGPFSVILYTNMAVSAHGCKPRINQVLHARNAIAFVKKLHFLTFNSNSQRKRV